MLHMEAESEVIRKLRYQLDNWDEQQELLKKPERFPEESLSHHQHVQLCSPDTNSTTISAYNLIIHREHEILDLDRKSVV